MKTRILAALTAAVLPLSAAGATDVATFLSKAEALERKGMTALFTSDYKAMKAEVENAGL